MKILVFDNYDSFTYNLVHLVEKLGNVQVEVYRNDQIALEDISKYDKIILSPGPGIPSEAGLLLDVIREYAASKSILGVCLGHQAIGEAFGGKIENLDKVFHGIATPCNVTADSLIFKDMPETFEVGRYHSWIVTDESLPAELEVTARDSQNLIMAMQHKNLDVMSVQFHPESVLTPLGDKIMNNWLRL